MVAFAGKLRAGGGRMNCCAAGGRQMLTDQAPCSGLGSGAVYPRGGTQAAARDRLFRAALCHSERSPKQEAPGVTRGLAQNAVPCLFFFAHELPGGFFGAVGAR